MALNFRDWDRWFASYLDYLLEFAELARDIHADLLSIGVEFKSSTAAFDNKWRYIIARIKEVYSGALTYSANWDEIEQISFWDELDFIGVNAFWPIAREPADRYLQMKENVKTIADNLESLYVIYNKPILFTEMGIKSSLGSALAPWQWPEHLSNEKYSEEYQADGYDAILNVMTDRFWFKGLFIWKYFADPYDETQEPITGFSPQNKLAESVLENYFQKEWML